MTPKKTITINGQTYLLGAVQSVNGTTPDENGNIKIPTGGSAEGAVLYTEQKLTEEQKAQARANIGAADAARLNTLEKNAIEQLYIHGYEDELPDGTWAYVYPIGSSELSDLAEDCGNSSRTVYIHFYAEGNIQHTRWFSADWRYLDGFRYDDDLQAYVKVKSYGERITALEENIGDISTALDHIIALQEELVGS